MFLIRVRSAEETVEVNKYFKNKGYRAIPYPSRAYDSYKNETTLFVDAIARSVNFSSFKFYSGWAETKDLPTVAITEASYRRF